MAFLFKSKKNGDRSQSSQATRDVPGVANSQSSLVSNGRMIQGEKGTTTQQTPTPSSSVNNSITSLQEKAPPSPEQLNGRRGPSSEQVSELTYRNGPSPPTSSSSSSLYPWSQRRLTFNSPIPSPFPRYGAAVNSVSSKDGDIYMMGGLINSSTVKGDLWMVEAGGNMTCYPLATTAEGPGPRVGHASLLVGNAFIVYGGDTKMDDADILDETLYLLNTSTRQWSRAVPAGPRPPGRYGHSLNILGSRIYVFGGQVEEYFMNDLVAFDLNQLQNPANRWETLLRNSTENGPPVGQVPPPRTNHTVVTYNEKLYLFGGTNGFQWFNDVWVYDPLLNTWAILDCIGYIPAPREGHASAIVDDVMYVFGGRTEEGTDLGDLAAFRISSKRWYTFQNMGQSPSPRSGHSMTAHGKNIVILAGEPSTTTREATDLGIAYILDTSKIHYPPNDKSVQPAPAADRVPARRMSNAEKSIMPASRGLSSRDGSSGLPEPKRLNGPQRESVMGSYGRGAGPFGPGLNDMNGMGPGPNQGPPGGSKLPMPRASMAQAPSGPPPQQQAPAPRPNGQNQMGAGRGRPPGPPGSQQRSDRGFGPAVDTNFQSSPLDNIASSPIQKESPQPRESPLQPNGQQTSVQQPLAKSPPRQDGAVIPQPSSSNASGRSSSKSRSRQQGSIDSAIESPLRAAQNQQPPSGVVSRISGNSLSRRGSARNSQTVTLLKELDSAKNQNAWYASELELAKKAGYTPNPLNSPSFDLKATESFDDDDRPLIEALLAMKAELTNVQSSIDKQAIVAAKQIAEVEKQRDAAVNEALYAKAKLAAHTGSQSSTPQPDSDARDLESITADRSSDISRKLAAALANQQDLKNRLDLSSSELEAEKRARQLAEDTANASNNRLADLEAYKQQNSSQIESLKAELHESQVRSREDAITCTEAVAASQLIQAEKDELEKKYELISESTRGHDETFVSLREVVAATTETRGLLERKLEDEKAEREKIESKLSLLRAEHEARTSELETTTRKLRDAEELAEQNAAEARTHQQAVLAGLGKITESRDDTVKRGTSDDRTIALQGQVTSANLLVRKYQSEADTASEKLRSAEERIAGLEAYQEQTSRETMAIRKQLQNAMRETQALQASNSEMKQTLASQQLETNAVNVQHNTLKDILGERGMSPVSLARNRALSSSPPGSNPQDATRLRELEQQLAASSQAHQETKLTYEAREQEAEISFRDKLGQLENDYQSAVHYVKGTEKMLKRMKDELAKYKTENSRMKDQINDLEDKSARSVQDASGNWEEERSKLSTEIELLRQEMKLSSSQLERQLALVQAELTTTKGQRDAVLQDHEEAQRQYSTSTSQARLELEQLQEENELLERRAQDAEQKVSLLLDQVEHSVDNYRRQSRQPEAPPVSGLGNGHQRTLSGHDSISESSMYGADRNSMALDSLASELETLRTHWETTNKNYRLSTAFDFDERPNTKGDSDSNGNDLSSSLADWRKRLDAEEESSRSRKSSDNTLSDHRTKPGGAAGYI